MAGHDILLDSGTNEVEIAELVMGEHCFGVNVAKIKEFLPFKDSVVTHMPTGHPSVPGVFSLRGLAVPLIELGKHLNLPPSQPAANQVIVVTEFNAIITAFVVDKIEQIHRLSWDEFKPLNQITAVNPVQITGVVHVQDRDVLILDLEHIVGEIFPQSIINYDEAKLKQAPRIEHREEAKLFFAEDSAIIQKQVVSILNSVGYTDVTSFDNGQQALEAITALKERAQAEGVDPGRYLTLLVTDIEMPQMDGLTLCRKVRQELGLNTPVIIFSSLINEQMAAKCREVGANAYASKPKTEDLIELIDQLCFPQ